MAKLARNNKKLGVTMVMACWMNVLEMGEANRTFRSNKRYHAKEHGPFGCQRMSKGYRLLTITVVPNMDIRKDRFQSCPVDLFPSSNPCWAITSPMKNRLPSPNEKYRQQKKDFLFYSHSCVCILKGRPVVMACVGTGYCWRQRW